jgi:serine/threonine-protein kinase
METSLTDELVGRQLGNFVIERLLGVGGMAHVYLARDVFLGREVAIKALSPMFLTDPGYVERFRNEAHRVAALEHQNIVPILQFIEQDRGLYVVMPLYAESLRDVLDRKQRLPLNEAVRIVTEIGLALTVAHSHGLVHRDVKPGNILLDAQGKTALTDFGIARQAVFKGNLDALTLAGTGLPVGTPQYMPPEQLRGTNVDQRSDIYALGVVIYEMLTGGGAHRAGHAAITAQSRDYGSDRGGHPARAEHAGGGSLCEREELRREPPEGRPETGNERGGRRAACHLAQ